VPLEHVPLIPVFAVAPEEEIVNLPPAHQLLAGHVAEHVVESFAIYLPAVHVTSIVFGSHAVPAEFL